jgi:hypothetical protein
MQNFEPLGTERPGKKAYSGHVTARMIFKRLFHLSWISKREIIFGKSLSQAGRQRVAGAAGGRS